MTLKALFKGGPMDGELLDMPMRSPPRTYAFGMRESYFNEPGVLRVRAAVYEYQGTNNTMDHGFHWVYKFKDGDK